MSYQPPVLPPSGTTFAQFQQGGISAMLDRLLGLLQAAGATLAPTTAPTLSMAVASSTLPAATYFAVFTESNGIGETTASPVSLGVAVTLGETLTLTFPALQSGNVSRSAYLGTSGTGPFSLATRGITAGSVTYSAPLPVGGGPPPGVNSTDAISRTKISNLRAAKTGNLQYVFKNLSTFAAEWNSGRPIASEDTGIKIADAHIVWLALAQICQEAGVLMDANPGTLTTKPTAINSNMPVRTWP